MKKFLKILAVIGVIAVAAIAAVLYFTAADREIVRSFVLQVSSGAEAEAHGLLHSELQREISVSYLVSAFENAKPYSEVSFSSVETAGSSTSLEGVAKTADGCASKLKFEVLGGTITSFDIAPLCYK